MVTFFPLEANTSGKIVKRRFKRYVVWEFWAAEKTFLIDISTE
jgi:hypothetical protein